MQQTFTFRNKVINTNLTLIRLGTFIKSDKPNLKFENSARQSLFEKYSTGYLADIL